MSWGPFETLGGGGQAVVLLGALALFLAAGTTMSADDRAMRETGGPGIVPFELAGSNSRARSIMQAWGVDGRAAAHRQLVLDFVFLVGYGVGGAVILGAVAQELGVRAWVGVGHVARVLGWGFLVAALLDAVENGCLLRILAHAGDTRDVGGLAATAKRCATAKFALTALAVVFLILVVFPLALPGG